MDIKSAEESFQDVTFGDDNFERLISHLTDISDNNSYHLSLFVGKSEEQREKAVQRIANATDREILEIDANDIISKIESETVKNLDIIFKKYDAENGLLYLKNGTRLCGSYTGYTQSSVKYATPQERYFLTKVQKTGGVFIVAIDTSTDADMTIRRAAQSIVNFPPSQSMFQKLLRKLKGVSVHGHQIKTERPEHYGKTAGNING